MSGDSKDDFKPMAVTLPARYWVTVLALVAEGIQKTIAPQLKELQNEQGGPRGG